MGGPRFRAEPLTFGVEEEFLLADRESGYAAARADQILAEARRTLGDQATAEFYLTQVETRSVPHRTAAGLHRDLAGARRACAEAAEHADCLLVAGACAILTSAPLPTRGDERYQRVAQHLGPVLRSTECEYSGCHIHLGSLSRGEALDLSARLRPWLPVVQAAAANSPFAAGADRGCASWRGIAYARWPTVGPAPVLDEGGYEKWIDEALATGAVPDRAAIYWYARPSEHLPTLEIRVADVSADLDTTVLLAVLLRALAAVLLAEADDGRPPAPVDDARLVRNHRAAAESGLSARMFVPDTHMSGPETGTEQSAATLLRALFSRARPALEAFGDLPFAAATLRQLLERGTGADRQRAVYAGTRSWRAVIDDLAHRTARSYENEVL